MVHVRRRGRRLGRRGIDILRRAVPVAALLAAACGGDAPGPPEAVHTDSAGVVIVTHPPPASWDLPAALVEVVRVGEAEGAPEHLFTSLAGGLIRPDGSFVVADRDTREVRRFAADGRLLGVHGREGEGPGEYVFIRGMGRCRPEGFTVFDLSYAMSHYDAAGAFVEEEPVRLEGGTTPYHLACHAESGRRAVMAWDRASMGTQGFFAATAVLRVVDRDGAELFDLGTRIGSERWGRPSGSGPHPAGRATLFGFAGDELIVTDGSSFGFERWTADGRLAGIARVDVPPPDVDSLADAYLEWTLGRADDDDQRRAWRASVEEMEWPERAAFFGELVVTGEAVLAQEISFDGEGRWFVFDPDGTPRGWLPLPAGARLLDYRDGRVLVEERTALDVPRAVLYRLDPDPSPLPGTP